MNAQLGTDTQSYLELRAELDKLIRGDLLGPMHGPEEEVDESSVRGRYIVGLLAPKGQSVAAEELDDLAVSGAGDGQDGKSDSVVPQSASILPSSIGLTFAVAAQAQAIRVKVRWGRYRRTKSDFLETKEGKPKTVWKREPVEGVNTFALREGMLAPWSPDPENEQVYVRGVCRQRDEAWTVTLFLVNAQEQPKHNKDEAWLFQPEVTVSAPSPPSPPLTPPNSKGGIPRPNPPLTPPNSKGGLFFSPPLVLGEGLGVGAGRRDDSPPLLLEEGLGA